MHDNKEWVVALSVSAAFIVANSILMSQEQNALLLVPLVGLVVAFFVMRFEQALLSIALLTPFAINTTLLGTMQLSLPSEPMMILLSALFLFRILVDKNYDRAILRHPVSMAVLAQLGWMVVTSLTAVEVVTSLKYTAARMWFVLPFFFAGVQVFRNRKRAWQLFWCYVVSLSVVIAISTYKTLGNFNDLQMLHRVMKPFYNDHTAYGCVIALMMPAAVEYIVSRGLPLWRRLAAIALFGALCVGFGLSYCRAAWISVAAALMVYLLIRMGMKLKWMMLGAVVCVGLFFANQSDILYNMGKNKQDSSRDLAGQLQSISNISTDASNLERLNRWASAFRMFAEKPLYGCGPGNYQFLYASYQRSYQLSTISTDFGDLGNAHSEYIGPLTEQGVPGGALVVAVFALTFATGVRVYRTAANRAEGRMALGFTLSLLTYYIHGVFNNFLDTDKLSVPFWAFTAIVVSLDLYGAKKSVDAPRDNINNKEII